MSETSVTPWSNDPNAPQVPAWLHIGERERFAGVLIGAISYGIAVALFFQCMGALLNPINPIKRGIKWVLVAHTVALFLFLTIPVGIELENLSIGYINNREFPGNDQFPPGPTGYGDIVELKATATAFHAMFPLNQWLADGLLLHRCYIIYSMNHWVMAFPYLMYLASVALGITSIYYYSPGMGSYTITNNIATSYNSISLLLNVLLTLMIVMRLIVHIRDIRNATVASDRSNGLHTAAATVVTMLVESYALYAGILLAYIILLALKSWVVALFSGAVGAVQVVAPYLVILRVAKQRAMTSESISGITESIRFRSNGSTDGGGSLPDGDPTDATEVNVEAPGEPSAGNENVIEEVRL